MATSKPAPKAAPKATKKVTKPAAKSTPKRSPKDVVDGPENDLDLPPDSDELDDDLVDELDGGATLKKVGRGGIKPKPRAKGKPGAHGKYSTRNNWSAMQEDFVEGIPGQGNARTYPSLKDISIKHGVPYQSVRARSAKDRWTELREKAQIRTAIERQKRRSKEMANNAIEFDDRSYNAANMGVVLIQTRLAEIMQELGARKKFRDDSITAIKAGLPVSKEEMFSAIYHRELEGLASALDRFTVIGQKSLGIQDGFGAASLVPEETTVPINISQELTRDDPERATAVLAAMLDAGQLPPELLDALKADSSLLEDEATEDEESDGTDV